MNFVILSIASVSKPSLQYALPEGSYCYFSSHYWEGSEQTYSHHY